MCSILRRFAEMMKQLVRLLRPYRLCSRSLFSVSNSLKQISSPIITDHLPSTAASIRFYCEQRQSATSFHVQDYDDFKERVLNSETPVVVDFFAE